jgi:methylmalonyl-CoA mutase
MINDLVQKSDYPTGNNIAFDSQKLHRSNAAYLAKLISCAENFPEEFESYKSAVQDKIKSLNKKCPVLGITGTGGAGKSSLVDEFVRRFLFDQKDKNIAIISVDPSKRKTGGALLGDRIRMNSINNNRVYMRSLATRQSNLALSKHVDDAITILKAADYDLIILETSGIGQSDTEITEHSDVSLYVMTPEYGAASQLEKIDMLDFADLIAINKFDKKGSIDAIRDVKKQYQRNHKRFEDDFDLMPVYGTIASQFNDPGMNKLYIEIINTINSKCEANLSNNYIASDEMSEKIFIIPSSRNRYLSEISETIRTYNHWSNEQAELAQKLYQLKGTLSQLND